MVLTTTSKLNSQLHSTYFTMSRRWRTPLLALSLIAPSFVFASQAFENTAIVRTIELGGSLVHVTTTYAVKVLEVGSSVYTVALGPEERKKTSWVEARVKGQSQSLALEELGYDDKRYVLIKGILSIGRVLVNRSFSKAFLFGVELDKPLPVDSTVNIVFDTVETHATFPWPQTASQEEEQKLKYNTSLFIVSPYHTAVQRTKFK